MTWETQEEAIRGWIGALLEGIDAFVSEETKAKIFEKSGRSCAQDTVPLFKKLWEETQDLEKFVAAVDREARPESQWELKGNETDKPELHISYNGCYCYLRALKLVDTPSLCHCSPGWLKEILETILGKPIEIERLYSVHKPSQHGACGCKFVAKL
ncbi:MAG: hypothetical protein ACE5OZ_18545 [Candidatus Heimdallarchaeota archaeon]